LTFRRYCRALASFLRGTVSLQPDKCACMDTGACQDVAAALLRLGTRRRSSAVPRSGRAGPQLALVVDTTVGEAAGTRFAAESQLRQRHVRRMGMYAAAMAGRAGGIQEQRMLHHRIQHRVGTEGAD
jgi:hypothetical protein